MRSPVRRPSVRPPIRQPSMRRRSRARSPLVRPSSRPPSVVAAAAVPSSDIGDGKALADGFCSVSLIDGPWPTRRRRNRTSLASRQPGHGTNVTARPDLVCLVAHIPTLRDGLAATGAPCGKVFRHPAKRCASSFTFTPHGHRHVRILSGSATLVVGRPRGDCDRRRVVVGSTQPAKTAPLGSGSIGQPGRWRPRGCADAP